MKIDIHISDITPQEMQKFATWLNDGRRFQLNTNADSGGSDTAADIISVSNNPRGKTSARPVVGQKGTRIEQWPSITACAEALEVAQSTVQRAIKNRTNMNTGWRLWYKADPMPEADETPAAPQATEATLADIPDDPDAPEWSRQPVRIKGIAGKEVRHWQSIYQCCRELGANYGQVRHAYKHYGKVNGWMLMTDDEEKLGSA